MNTKRHRLSKGLGFRHGRRRNSIPNLPCGAHRRKDRHQPLPLHPQLPDSPPCSLCSKQLSVSRLGLLGRRALSSAATPHYDVVIAGGGVMGCSVAYHLAESSNLKIAVAERDCTVRFTLLLPSPVDHGPYIWINGYSTNTLPACSRPAASATSSRICPTSK